MQLKKYTKKGCEKLFSFLFPSLCLHCHEQVKETAILFCPACTPFFELIEPWCRCTRCFKEIHRPGVCLECRQKKRWSLEVAAALEYIGPVTSFIHGLKYGRAPYLARAGASWMVLQWERLQWPQPEVIIPIPMPWMQKVSKGHDHASLLAKEIGKYLQVPVMQPLIRFSDGLPQGKKAKKHRLQLDSKEFSLRQKQTIADKTVLLVDDLLATGTTLQAAAEALSTGYPRKVYGLSLSYQRI